MSTINADRCPICGDAVVGAELLSVGRDVAIAHGSVQHVLGRPRQDINSPMNDATLSMWVDVASRGSALSATTVAEMVSEIRQSRALLLRVADHDCGETFPNGVEACGWCGGFTHEHKPDCVWLELQAALVPGATPTRYVRSAVEMFLCRGCGVVREPSEFRKEHRTTCPEK
jgi:hypothetical protein